MTHTRDSRSTIFWEILSLLYIAIPAIIFCLTFFDWRVALPISLLLSSTIVWELRSSHRAFQASRTGLAWDGLIVSVAASVLVLAVTGFALDIFAWDWIKHWALLDLLAKETWPVETTLPGYSSQWLRFYVGAYVVPAGLSKLAIMPLEVATALWFGLGTLLLLLLVNAAVEANGRLRALAAPLLFLLVSGADNAFQQLLRSLLDYPSVPWFTTHSESWAQSMVGRPLQYTGILAQLTWVPHQAIAGAIATLLVLRRSSRSTIARIGLIIGVLSIHSPYAAIGLSPFAIAFIIRERHELLESNLRIPALVGLFGGAAFGFSTLFYLKGDLPAGALLCLSCQTSSDFLKIAIFLIVELSLIVLCLTKEDIKRTPVIIALATLITLPFFGGALPDPVMRISMPALVVLAVYAVTRTLTPNPTGSGAHQGYGPLLPWLLMAVTAVGEAGYHLTGGAGHKNLTSGDYLRGKAAVDFATGSNFDVTEFFERCGWEFRTQYFSNEKPPVLRSDDR